MKFLRIIAICFSLPLLVFVSACSHATLKMNSTIDPTDKSVTSADIQNSKFKKIMVIPPQGTVRGQFDTVVAIVEREFLKKGVTVISAAVTGRVVLEASNKEEKGGQAAVNLSDAERALVMAKQSGADAILQIGSYNWDQSVPTRFFILNDDNIYEEVSRQKYINIKDAKRFAFSSQVLSFIGRLVDTQSGEVCATFDISCAGNWNMPGDYTATILEKKGINILDDENYSYANANWKEIQDITTEKVIQRVVKRIGG